jgi:hypothetical protein
MHSGNADITAITEIHEVSVSVYYVSVAQITQLLTVTTDQAVTERNSSHLVGDELDKGHYDTLLPVEEKERFSI